MYLKPSTFISIIVLASDRFLDCRVQSRMVICTQEKIQVYATSAHDTELRTAARLAKPRSKFKLGTSVTIDSQDHDIQICATMSRE